MLGWLNRKQLYWFYPCSFFRFVPCLSNTTSLSNFIWLMHVLCRPIGKSIRWTPSSRILDGDQFNKSQMFLKIFIRMLSQGEFVAASNSFADGCLCSFDHRWIPFFNVFVVFKIFVSIIWRSKWFPKGCYVTLKPSWCRGHNNSKIILFLFSCNRFWERILVIKRLSSEEVTVSWPSVVYGCCFRVVVGPSERLIDDNRM